MIVNRNTRYYLIFNTKPKKLKSGMKVKVARPNGKLSDTPDIVGSEFFSKIHNPLEAVKCP